MSGLINADELMDFIENRISDGSEDPASQYTIIRDEALMELGGMVKSMETVDAEPVKHAHWVERRSNNGNMHYICSHCGKEVSYPYAKRRWKYCVECGAKMDEELPEEGDTN